jgi:hypothetical protein
MIKKLLINKNKKIHDIIFSNNKRFKIIYYPDMEHEDYDFLANELYGKINNFSNKKLIELC